MKCLVTTIFFFLLSQSMVSNPAAQSDSSEWQATVTPESAALYAGLSVSSPVVAMLKRGDFLAIKLEITGEGGTWYAVTEQDHSATGYVPAHVVELRERDMSSQWEYQPPPEAAPPSEKKSSGLVDPAIAASSKGRIETDIKSFFASKFGRTLPVSAFGQTRLHSRLGFDHRNGVDVALNPDSAEGRSLLGRLRSSGIPFIAFRHAIPGIATGAHIHVGRPSPRK